MRVLSLIHGPAYGGAHNQARVLAEPLRARGIETTVVLPTEAGAAARALRDQVDVVQLGLHRLRASPDPRINARMLAAAPREIMALQGLIREVGADVVQSHGATNPHGAIAARRSGVASLWQIFDTRAPRALRRIAMPLVVRLSDAATVWGEELVRMHPGLERLGDRLTIVYPPVEAERFRPNPSVRDEVRSELGIANDEVLIGSIGVLNPQKGHEYTIRAAARIAARYDRVRFLIAGTDSPAHGAYRHQLEAEIRDLGLTDRLTMIDPKGRVDRVVQAFDIFWMTSVPRSEGMPTVILEAMIAGKPVVATDVGAVRELFEDGVSGFAVPPLEVERIADAAERLIADAGLRNAVAAAAGELARKRFGLDHLADLHAQAYETAHAYAGLGR